MATFAERFKKIQKKYFDKSSTGELVPPNSKTTMAAFDSEVQYLFKEQEALKAQQQAQQPQQAPQQGMPPQQFAMGGTLPSVGNIFGGGGNTEVTEDPPETPPLKARYGKYTTTNHLDRLIAVGKSHSNERS